MDYRTPLEKIQDEAADVLMSFLDPGYDEEARRALNAFLVRAFDAGVTAVNELNKELRTQ